MTLKREFGGDRSSSMLRVEAMLRVYELKVETDLRITRHVRCIGIIWLHAYQSNSTRHVKDTLRIHSWPKVWYNLNLTGGILSDVFAAYVHYRYSLTRHSDTIVYECTVSESRVPYVRGENFAENLTPLLRNVTRITLRNVMGEKKFIHK